MEKRVTYQDSIGTDLVGIISNPDRDKQKPVVILVHGFASSKDSRTFPSLVKKLEEQNITSFRIDLYAHGESEGNFEEITISKAVDGIISAYNFLKKEGYNHIGLFGSSFGGNSSIMAASKLKNIFTLVLKCPDTNYKVREEETKTQKELADWKLKGYRMRQVSKGKELKINYSMFEDSKNNNGWEIAPTISIPTLIIHGDKDEIVPVNHSIKMSKLMPDCTLHIIIGAGHRFEKPKESQELIETSVSFIVDKAKN